MVEQKQSGFEKIVKMKGLTYIMILPYFEPHDLFHFAMLNKHCMSLLDPQSPHCVNYKVLYESQGHTVTEEDEVQAKKSLSTALQLFTWPREIKKHQSPTKDQTFARIDPTSGRRELIGYGGSNPSMNIDPRYVTYIEREDSLLGKQCVFVKSVCWMDPWARIENIPKNTKEVDIFLYHTYLLNFYMESDIEIMLAPQKTMTTAIWDPSFKVVKTVQFPMPGWQKQPKEKMIKEHICKL